MSAYSFDRRPAAENPFDVRPASPPAAPIAPRPPAAPAASTAPGSQVDPGALAELYREFAEHNGRGSIDVAPWTTLSAKHETANGAVSGLSLGAAHALAGGGSLSGRLGLAGGAEGPTTSYGVDARLVPTPALALNGRYSGETGPDGTRHAAGLGLDVASPDGAVAHRLGLQATAGTGEETRIDGSASATARIADKVYATGFAGAGGGPGVDPSWFAGGGLTYMPTSKIGVTAAGGYGSDGAEARLGVDYFKHGVDGAGSLEEQRARALVGAYVGLSQGGSQLDGVLGAGRLEKEIAGNEDLQVALGLKVRF